MADHLRSALLALKLVTPKCPLSADIPSITTPDYIRDLCQLNLSHSEGLLLRTALHVLRNRIAHVWMLVLFADFSDAEGGLVENCTRLLWLSGTTNHESHDLPFSHLGAPTLCTTDGNPKHPQAAA